MSISFWKNEAGNDMCESSLAHVALLAVALLIAYLIRRCSD